MPIHPDARQVPGQPNRVITQDGRTVTRAQALSEGARYMGYRSHYDLRRHVSGDRNYVNAWLNTAQGRQAMDIERARARAEGRRFNASQFRSRVVAARNARGNPRSNREARQAYLDFAERYDFTDEYDYMDY